MIIFSVSKTTKNYSDELIACFAIKNNIILMIHNNTINSSFHLFRIGMGKEVENLITENNELLATK